MPQQVTIVNYEDIVKHPSDSHSLRSQLEQAYGTGSIGVLAIRNVPKFVETKQSILPLAYDLAHLPKDYLESDQLTDAASLYNAGWSFGKEKLKDDVPDTSKGSFYFNPLTDEPGTPEDRATYSASYPCNKWPTERLPALEIAAKEMGNIMKDVVVHLAKHIDDYARSKMRERKSEYRISLHRAMESTEKAKGRLLYYFPLQSENTPSEDSWIGWHNDSGFLTALAGDLYVNHETGEAYNESPDPEAGLYVVDRNNEVIQVDLPPDCLAVQMGECVQILTGGVVVATPHCVRGTSLPNVARISLPCFIDTPPGFPLTLPEGCTKEQVFALESRRVPPLQKRWTENGMSFGDFLAKTFETYYDWSAKGITRPTFD